MSTLIPMSPREFQEALNKSYQDFHRTYLFRVMFFDGILGAVSGALTTNLISTTDTPTSSTAAVNLGWQGSKLKIAGKTEYADWKVTVRDDAINVAYNYFQSWREKVYDVKNGSSSKIDVSGLAATLGITGGYKRSAIIMLLGNKTEAGITTLDQASTMRAYTIAGIWPKDIGPITLDYSTEQVASFPVTFSMDYFESMDATKALTAGISNIIKI